MSVNTSLDELWKSASRAKGIFDPASLADLPELVSRYLTHAIALAPV